MSHNVRINLTDLEYDGDTPDGEIDIHISGNTGDGWENTAIRIIAKALRDAGFTVNA